MNVLTSLCVYYDDDTPSYFTLISYLQVQDILTSNSLVSAVANLAKMTSRRAQNDEREYHFHSFIRGQRAASRVEKNCSSLVSYFY